MKSRAAIESNLRKKGGAINPAIDHFNDPFFTSGKQSSSKFTTRKPSKSAWRGVTGHAPTLTKKSGPNSLLPSNLPLGSKNRPLPKYLQGVGSRIKTDLDSLREFRSRAQKSRKDVALETVARRRLERFEETGVFDKESLSIHPNKNYKGGKGTASVLSEGLLAREIADMYAEVADDVLEGKNDGGQFSAYYGEKVEEGNDINLDYVNFEEEEIEEDQGMGATKSKNEKSRHFGAWAGEFDMSKSKGKIVDEKAVFEGGGHIADLKAKEREDGGKGGGDEEERNGGKEGGVEE
jgi:hypothetical protein